MKYWTFLLAALLVTPIYSQTPAPSESGISFRAADLLPSVPLIGESYRVREVAATDGYMAYFTIDTDFGEYHAIGVRQARHRIAETEAIRKLVETSKSDLFAEGVKRSIEQPIDAVKNIAKNPVESVKSAPKTVGHFFAKVGSSIGRGVSNTVERTTGDGPSPTAGQVGSDIGEAAKGAAGFGKAKLDTAKQLGIDPYSDNERLQEEMDKVTWAFFAGGLPLRVASTVASAGMAVAATNMIGVSDDIYALTEAELTRNDENSAEKMGLDGEAFKAFRMNRLMTVSRRHRLILALEAMPKAKGRAGIIAMASALETPEQIDFLTNALCILAERQRSGAATYLSLDLKGRLPTAMAADGTLQVPAPVDYVTWTPEVAHFASRDDLGTAQKILLHTGGLSANADIGIKSYGWTPVSVLYPR